MKKERKKLNFVFVTEYFPSKKAIDVRGGVEIRTYYLAKHLSKKYSVTVIASREKNKPDYQFLDKVFIKRVGLTSSYQQKGKFLARFAFILQAVWECLKVDISLLEGTGLLGQLVALIVSKIKKVTVVAFVPDLFSSFSLHLGFFHSIILKVMEKIIFTCRWDGYIAISREVKEKLVKMGIAVEKINLIYCGIDIENISKIKIKKTIYPSICSVSRLVAYKRIDLILQALTFLIKDFSRLRYYLIGDGQEYKEIEEIVKKLKIDQYVQFHRFLKDHNQVLRLIKKSWIYCSASTVEGFGIATIEAMAGYTPFVISDIPINREITLGKGGLFFKPTSINDLVNQLRKLLSREDLRLQLIKDNLRVITNYSVSKMVQKTEDLFLKLISN